MAPRGTNRFVISCFPQPVEMDPLFAEKTWATLRAAISEINSRNTSNLSFEQLYRYAYNMVLHKHGDFLYTSLTDLLTSHLRGVAATVLDADPPAFLPELKTQWAWFSLSLEHVRDVLMYMDRYYVTSKQKKTVYELGLALFRDVVVRHAVILPRLRETLLESIDRERNGEAVDTHLIRAITRMLAELGLDHDGRPVYVNVFENGFLERTKLFYAREAKLYLSETTCSEYLRKASSRIQEERLRVETYLEARTASRVRRVTEVELIEKYVDTLVDMENSGLIWMLRCDKVVDLQLMYSLFRSIQKGDELLRAKLKSEVLDRGSELVQDTENVRDPIALINTILALKAKYDKIVTFAFQIPSAAGHATPSDGAASTAGNMTGSTMSDVPPYTPVVGSSATGSSARPSSGATGGSAMKDVTSTVSAEKAKGVVDRRFASAVNEAFERFINRFTRSAEYTSLYVDKLLRKDFKTTNDDEIETKLDNVMTLFRYLHDKDVFERYYKQHLTKRLLHARTASSDAERSMISKMKTECGFLFTSKMEVMFNDMKTSEDTTAAFKEKVKNSSTDMHGIDLSVSVLTTMSWPIPPPDHSNASSSSERSAPIVNLPVSVVHCTAQFEEFYYGKHEGRRLTWQYCLGTADIRASFGNGSRQVDLVSVSAFSVCVLMLFNDTDTMTYSEIAAATQIPENELIRYLQSLSLAKYRVLKKEPKDKEVKPTDKFSFNNDFTCRNRRIKMQIITAQRETESERNQTKGRIDDDRRPVIDTVLVRIMKHRKVLDHNTLMVEATTQLSSRFEPNPQDIKERIESLMEREYLRRQSDNRNVYEYLA